MKAAKVNLGNYRNFKPFNEKYFNVGLKCTYWCLATKNDDLDLGFRTYFHLFNKTLEKHVPMKQGMRKVKKLELKPWTTKGIKTFMTNDTNNTKKLSKKRIANKNQEI